MGGKEEKRTYGFARPIPAVATKTDAEMRIGDLAQVLGGLSERCVETEASTCGRGRSAATERASVLELAEVMTSICSDAAAAGP